MGGYTKLFSEILTSSIWNEDDKTRIVWITLLALSDMNGIVKCAKTSLAIMARVKPEDCVHSLLRLESPDPESKNPDCEGRRIKQIDGGWLILNYENYRDKLSTDKETIQARERMRRMRERNTNITLRNPVVVDVVASESTLKGDSKGGNSQEWKQLFDWLNKIYQRVDLIEHWNYDEQYLLCQTSKRPHVLTEIKELTDFWERAMKAPPQPGLRPAKAFLPQNVLSCLRKWNETLDRARNTRPKEIVYGGKT